MNMINEAGQLVNAWDEPVAQRTGVFDVKRRVSPILFERAPAAEVESVRRSMKESMGLSLIRLMDDGRRYDVLVKTHEDEIPIGRGLEVKITAYVRLSVAEDAHLGELVVGHEPVFQQAPSEVMVILDSKVFRRMDYGWQRIE